ncbi:MAG: Rieske (2Fe-2S) protein [Haloarculaceae archaeon]
MDDGRRIVAVDDVPADGTVLFTVRDGFDLREAILIRTDAGDDAGTAEPSVTAWKNYCQHWTDVRFDKGSGGLVRDGELVCQKHGATFRSSDGYCTHGPCEGAYLAEVDVTVRDGDVFLTDDRYEFEKLGPSGEHDLSSRGRIDF